jgi:SanA protein
MNWFKMKQKKMIFRLITGAFCLAISVMAYANYRVYAVSDEFLFSNVESIPKSKTALLLGTSRTLRNGNLNAYFYLRIDACVRLYNSGKVKQILISGDNSVKSYNEPEEMKKELEARGIPSSVIYLDFAGFDTYDSVIRAKKIFGQDEFIVVSQKFHNQRALYIAWSNGIHAYGYNAKDVKKMSGIKTKAREYLACVKAVMDVTFNVDPYFLGKKEVMP